MTRYLAIHLSSQAVAEVSPNGATMMNTDNISELALATGPDFDFVLEGERLFAEGRLEEARAMFQAAADHCPGNAMAWNNLAVVAISEDNDRQAENYLRQALEVRSDMLEARFNLVEIYSLRSQWPKAAKELHRILERHPADLPAIRRLAQVYISMGQPDKARELMEDPDNMGAIKSFIDSLWLGIKYYAMADDLSPREKLEKYTGAILKFLDGQGGRSRRYRLVSFDPDQGREVSLEGFFESFYYKERPGLSLGESEGDQAGLVLTIGENEDWLFFREVLRAEMKAEGGCLGDFTQTRKVMRREARLAKYSLPATLKYFQDNVGPCDCHALRAVLV